MGRRRRGAGEWKRSRSTRANLNEVKGACLNACPLSFAQGDSEKSGVVEQGLEIGVAAKRREGAVDAEPAARLLRRHGEDVPEPRDGGDVVSGEDIDPAARVGDVGALDPGAERLEPAGLV